MRYKLDARIAAWSLGVLAACLAGEVSVRAEDDSGALFRKRILPIFNAPRPSSCAECHLSGVDLKDYIRPTERETLSSLVEAGLVNVDRPDDSKILTFITRRPERPSLVSERVRKEEFEAFRSWIRHAVKRADLLDERAAGPIGPKLPEQVIRHARKDRILASFLDHVWTEVGRCAACHSPDQNKEQVRKHGERVSWITLNDPAATLNHMLEADLIDLRNPAESLLLQKPTLQVEHGGGQKMVVGDRTYKQFRRFIDDYAAAKRGDYTSVQDLPPQDREVSVVSEIWLKIVEVPEKFDQQLLQVDLYRWEDGNWSEHRVATSDRPVFGKGRLWQHSLSLTSPREAISLQELARQKLPPGKYLARIYVDRQGKLAREFTNELDATDLVGEVEFQSGWKPGYGSMTVIRYPGAE